MRGLGELEAAVMDVLWQTDDPLKVRDVLDRLDPAKPLAYTTVMTVLDNLHRKSWVHREMHGRAWHYHPTAPGPRRQRKCCATCWTPPAIPSPYSQAYAVVQRLDPAAT